MSSLITVAGILVTGGVAIFGYLHTSRVARRERIAQTLAQAISAVGDYEDLPYRVRRRPSSDPATRSQLSERASDIHSRLDFHSAWLRISAPVVAQSYDHLISEVRGEVGGHIKKAWLEPPIEQDQDMNLGLGAQYQCPRTDAARDVCIAAMRNYLRSS